MKDLFASFLSFIGLGAATTGSQACIWLFLDEPKCPKSLVK
ncbi:MAG: cyclic lactone autoinducer peptide [Bacilli bacterium]|nr:cyclic lactone autoinducer peptide [Bacilli bacterium]